LIEAGNRLGTGFYVAKNGDVVTARHVIGNIIFRVDQPQDSNVQLTDIPLVTKFTGANEENFQTGVSALEVNGDAWTADLMLIHTGHATTCWLKEADDSAISPGDHLIALGFPGLSFGSLSMYSGIVSARLRNSGLPNAMTSDGRLFTTQTEYIRLQMPISPGVSGAPVIDDHNHVVGVVTNAGAWSPDLEALTQLQRARESQPASPQDPMDLMALTAHLALVIHDFASPGYGDAVPLRYLRKREAEPTQKLSSDGR
jgi:hypothetical protein